jgi:uncharacterized membrane protein
MEQIKVCFLVLKGMNSLFSGILVLLTASVFGYLWHGEIVMLVGAVIFAGVALYLYKQRKEKYITIEKLLSVLIKTDHAEVGASK